MRTHALIVPLGLLLCVGCGDKDGDDTTAGSSAGSTESGTDSDSSSSQGTGASSASSGASGGQSGTGASSASGTAGGSGGSLTCATDEDCKLYSDCCSCQAAHVDASVDQCDAACDVTTCESWGARGAVCRDGTCVIRPINCNEDMITCDAPTPQCPDGFRPGVTDDGTCWTGKCVPADLCA